MKVTSFVYLIVQLIHYAVKHAFDFSHVNSVVILTDILLMDGLVGLLHVSLQFLDRIPDNLEEPTKYSTGKCYDTIDDVLDIHGQPRIRETELQFHRSSSVRK